MKSLFNKNTFKDIDFADTNTPLGQLGNHPVMEAMYIWNIIKKQVQTLLGKEIFNQWFINTTPITISNDILVIECNTLFQSKWLLNHYKEVCDILASIHKKDLSVFFISEGNFKLECSTSKINSATKY